MTFGVDGADGFVKPLAPDDDCDSEFARTLGDGDDVDVFARDGGKDSARESGEAPHAFAYDGEEADFAIHIDTVDVAVREFEGERGFDGLCGVFEFVAANQEAEALAIAGTGEREHFDVGPV